jgi:prepilin-type N-terminal cleavage/methylation domain-containing protein
MMSNSSEKGFSLVEVMFALGILTVGVLGAAGIISQDMQRLGSSPADVIVTQKAQQAIEAVFAARDSHRLTWAQIRNVQGISGHDDGVFLDAALPLYLAGPDGLVNTNDDIQTVESFPLPGKDGRLGTSDDGLEVLANYTRQITIRDVANEDGNLRTITVTVTFQNGATKQTYVLSSLISAYA